VVHVYNDDALIDGDTSIDAAAISRMAVMIRVVSTRLPVTLAARVIIARWLLVRCLH